VKGNAGLALYRIIIFKTKLTSHLINSLNVDLRY
jgi:hypothetical protein